MSESHNLEPEYFSELNEDNAGYEGLISLGYTPESAKEKLKQRAAEDDFTINMIRKMAESERGRRTLRSMWEEWIRQEVEPPFLAALTPEQIELIRSDK